MPLIFALSDETSACEGGGRIHLNRGLFKPFSAETFVICLCFSLEGCPSHFVRLWCSGFPARLLFVEICVVVRSSLFS